MLDRQQTIGWGSNNQIHKHTQGQCCYNIVNFLLNPLKWHPIVHLLGRAFVSLKCHLCSAAVIAVLMVILWKTGPRYNSTRLYMITNQGSIMIIIISRNLWNDMSITRILSMMYGCMPVLYITISWWHMSIRIVRYRGFMFEFMSPIIICSPNESHTGNTSWMYVGRGKYLLHHSHYASNVTTRWYIIIISTTYAISYLA